MGDGEQMRNDGQWDIEAERRAGPIAQAVGDGVALVEGEDAQIGNLWQVLAMQSVVVLADTSLPGTVLITEVDLHARYGAQLVVPAHFLALVVRESATHRLGNRFSLAEKPASAEAAVASCILASNTIRLVHSTSTQAPQTINKFPRPQPARIIDTNHPGNPCQGSAACGATSLAQTGDELAAQFNTRLGEGGKV